MKIYLVVALSLIPSFAFCQKQKYKLLKESKVQIISFDVEQDPNKLPVIIFTLQNKTRENIIFSKIGLILKEYKKHPKSSSSNNDLMSKELIPIAAFDISIPEQEGEYTYNLKAPIQIVAKDAATVQLRLNCVLNNKYIVPSQIGFFKFDIVFLTYDFKLIKSTDITLGIK